MSQPVSSRRGIKWLRQRLTNLTPAEDRYPIRLLVDVTLLAPVKISGKKLNPQETRNLLKLLSRADSKLIRVLQSIHEPQAWDAFLLSLFHWWRKQKMPKEGRWIVYTLGWLGSAAVVPHLIVFHREMLNKRWYGQEQAALSALHMHNSPQALWYLLSLWAEYREIRIPSLLLKIAKRQATTVENLILATLPDLDIQYAELEYQGNVYFLRYRPSQRFDWIDKHGTILELSAETDEVTNWVRQQEQEYLYWARTLFFFQTSLLEQHLINGQRWQVHEFQQQYFQHSLLRYLAQQLIWGVYTPDDQLQQTFRVAEDLTLADSYDRLYTLPANAIIGLIHPLETPPDELRRWTDLLYDYAIVQPFPQLARETYRPTSDDFEKQGLVMHKPKNSMTRMEFDLIGGWQQQNGYWGAQRSLVRQKDMVCSIQYDWFREEFRCLFLSEGKPMPLEQIAPIVMSEAVYFLHQTTRPKSP